MLEFFEQKMKKRAFIKALKEVTAEEAEARYAKSSRANAVTRAYKTDADANTLQISNPNKLRYKNSLSKPDTDFIDLKKFKDWRNLNKPAAPKQSFPPFKDNKPAAPISSSKASDEEENHISMPGGDFIKRKQLSAIDIAATKLNLKSDRGEIDNSSRSFLEERARRQSTLQDMIDKYKSQTKATNAVKEPAGRLEMEEKPNRIKLEIVEAEKPEAKTIIEKPQTKVVNVANSDQAVTKKKTNRKPRGKSKRRFDADVITSIDW